MKTHMKSITAFFAILLGVGASAQTLQDAIRLTDNEQYEKARSIFKVLITKEPTNGDNFFYYGDLLLKMDNPDSAKIIFQKGLDINPTNALTHVGMGRYFMYNGDAVKGQQEIVFAKSLITTQSGKKEMNMGAQRQVQIYLEIAETETWAPNPNYGDAIDLTNTCEKLDGKNAEIFLIRGDAFYRKDPVNGTPAIGEYLKAYKIDPKNPKANVRIGILYYNGKNMPAAIGYFNNALKTDSTFAPAWRYKGEAQYQIQKFDSAQKCMATYLRLNDGPLARYRYCLFLHKAGMHNEAIEQGKVSLAKDSSTTVIYRIIGRSYFDSKTPDAAKSIEYFNKFFAKQKIAGSPVIIAEDFVYRARAYSKNGQDSLAVIDYNKVLEMDTARKDLYFDIATSYYKMKKYDQAAVFYKKKIDVNPTAANITDWVAYGRSLYSMKDYANADIAFKKGISLDVKNPAGWLWRAKANAFLDPESKLDSTRIFYETFYGLAIAEKEKNKKDLIAAGKYLGGYHFIKKNYDCSKGWFTFVMELDPANAKVKEQLDTDKDIKAAKVGDINACLIVPVPAPTPGK